MATAASIETKLIWSQSHYNTHGTSTPDKPHGLPPTPRTTPLKSEDKMVFKVSTPPQPSLRAKEEEEDEEEDAKSTYTPSYTPPSAFYTPLYTPPSPSSSSSHHHRPANKITKPTKQKSKPNQKLFLKLRLCKSITPPQTPFNTTHPFFMQPARNQIRRAEFLEAVAEGMSPLLGRQKGRCGEGVNALDLVDMEGDVKEDIEREKGEGEKGGGEREAWLKKVFWGKGRWAVRSDEEDRKRTARRARWVC